MLRGPVLRLNVSGRARIGPPRVAIRLRPLLNTKGLTIASSKLPTPAQRSTTSSMAMAGGRTAARQSAFCLPVINLTPEAAGRDSEFHCKATGAPGAREDRSCWRHSPGCRVSLGSSRRWVAATIAITTRPIESSWPGIPGPTAEQRNSNTRIGLSNAAPRVNSNARGLQMRQSRGHAHTVRLAEPTPWHESRRARPHGPRSDLLRAYRAVHSYGPADEHVAYGTYVPTVNSA